MNSEDVRKITFDRVRKGYQPEDVDAFLMEVSREMEIMEAEKQDLENKMYILAQKVEEYRGQEDTLKTALINAQRMGETVVHEAKTKADAMVRDASGKAELLRQQAEQEIQTEYYVLEKLRDEIGRFKATILNLYKQHIESMSALDAPVAQVDEFLSSGLEQQTQPIAPQATGSVQAQERIGEEMPAVEPVAESVAQVEPQPLPTQPEPAVAVVEEEEEYVPVSSFVDEVGNTEDLSTPEPEDPPMLFENADSEAQKAQPVSAKEEEPQVPPSPPQGSLFEGFPIEL